MLPMYTSPWPIRLDVQLYLVLLVHALLSVVATSLSPPDQP